MYIDRNTVVKRDRQYEVMDPHSATEQAGYIPPQIQIENMMLAGQRLDDSRRALYDFPSEDEIDEDAYDPTRSLNYDLADASQMAMALEAEKLRKANQTAIEPTGGVKKGSEVPDVPPPEKGA